MQNVAMILKIQRRQAYAVIIGYKQAHQAIMVMYSDLGPLKQGDTVLVNMNTLELTLIERYNTESEAA